MIKLENYSTREYADLACHCNQNNLRIEIVERGVLAYALEKYEIISNGEVIDLRNDESYMLEQLNLAKEKKRKYIKQKCYEVIYNAYPDYKQRNIDREAYIYKEDAEKQQAQINMHTYIHSMRAKSNEFEAEIEACETLEDLELINIEF